MLPLLLWGAVDRPQPGDDVEEVPLRTDSMGAVKLSGRDVMLTLTRLMGGSREAPWPSAMGVLPGATPITASNLVVG